MEVLKADAWCIAVAVSFFGYGLALLRLLRRYQHRWLVAAGAGMGVVILILGVMNLLGWVHPVPLFLLVVLGDLLSIVLWKRPSAVQPENQTPPQARLGLKLIAWAALALVGYTAFAGLHNNLVNYFDDAQAYFTYPLQALQTGSLQPQPFSERRINTSLGANYLLDAVIAVGGDVRSMGFLDQSFAYLLYAAAMWAIWSRWGLFFEIKGLLLALLFAIPLIATNAAPVYLQSALILTLFLAMHETAECKDADWRIGIVWGLVGSVLCLTKSSGIVFVFLLMAIFAVCHSLRTRTLGQIKNSVIAGATILALAVPWMVQQRRNAGTYLSPILGRGFHASHWGVLPLPGHAATPWTIFMVALPDVLVLLAAAFLVWKLHSRSTSLDISLIAFMLTAAAATPLVAFGTGGEGVDRFSFPLHIPALFMFAGLLLGTPRDQQHAQWRRVSVTMVVIWMAGIFVVLGAHYHIYAQSIHRLEDAAGVRSKNLNFYELPLYDQDTKAEQERAWRAQNAVPAGAELMEATLFAYLYDFRRNQILVADYPGMAGWAPGIPVGRGPDEVRKYFLDHHIQYFLCDRRLTHNNEDIGDFFRTPTLDFTLHDVIRHHIHDIYPWSRMEWMVSRDVRHNLLLLADTDRRLYDDGTLVVVRLEGKQ